MKLKKVTRLFGLQHRSNPALQSDPKIASP